MYKSGRKQNQNQESILPNFFSSKRRIFLFFVTKLGHFIVQTPFVICYKHSSITVKIGKLEKWKFGRIDSSFFSVNLNQKLFSIWVEVVGVEKKLSLATNKLDLLVGPSSHQPSSLIHKYLWDRFKKLNLVKSIQIYHTCER